MREADTGWFALALAPEFLASMPDGRLLDRAAFLRHVREPSVMPELQAHDVVIRPVAGFAIVHARTTYRTTEEQTGSGRYTDVWVRRGGKWLAISAH